MSRPILLIFLAGSFLISCGESEPEYLSRAREEGKFSLKETSLDFEVHSSTCVDQVDVELIDLEAACIESMRNALNVEGEALCRQERLRIVDAVRAFFENSWFSYEEEREICLVETMRLIDEDLAVKFCDQGFEKKVKRLVETRCWFNRLQAEESVFWWSVE